MSNIKIKIENLYKIFGPDAKGLTSAVKDGLDKDELLAKYNLSLIHISEPTRPY